MPGSTDVKPAFGQVWNYTPGSAGPFMLVHPCSKKGEWTVLWLNHYFSLSSEMAGLHDDPKRRIDGYELLSEIES